MTQPATQGNKCYLCAKRFTKANPPTIEHLLPLAKGGDNNRENLVAAHQRCNSSKGAKTEAEYFHDKGQLL